MLRAIDGFDGQPTTQAALELMTLLFPRPGELRLAEWSGCDFQKQIWTIPENRMKMRRPHRSPLSRHTSNILQTLHTITGGCKLVFHFCRISPADNLRKYSECCITKTGLLQGRSHRARLQRAPQLCSIQLSNPQMLRFSITTGAGVSHSHSCE